MSWWRKYPAAAAARLCRNCPPSRPFVYFRPCQSLMKVSGLYVHDRPAQFVFLSLSRVLRYCLSCAHPRGQCGKTAEKKKKKSYSQHKERIKENKLRTSSGRSDSRAPFQKLKRCCRGWEKKFSSGFSFFGSGYHLQYPPIRTNWTLLSVLNS